MEIVIRTEQEAAGFFDLDVNDLSSNLPGSTCLKITATVSGSNGDHEVQLRVMCLSLEDAKLLSRSTGKIE